ncbi:MAG: 4Fe-4S dicluster domain-containing protein [Acidobacteria bacterium]|nr:4Fe-4S dicluster domain-containing protein [Acidobacteriota bacterium]
MENNSLIILAESLQLIFDNLNSFGYQTIAPTISENTIVYDQITKISDLPIGYIDEQTGGHYRLKKHSKPTFFSYTVGANSWKKYLHPPKVRLWQIKRKAKAMEFVSEETQPPKLAFIGVRGCELAAISIQDRVFLKDKFVDPIYSTRRKDIFIVAINCARAVKTCFCTSMQTGPKVEEGFDLSLTEILDDKKHIFLVKVATEKGREILKNIPYKVATKEDENIAENIIKTTAQSIEKKLDTENIKELLYQNYENPSWDEVANRCLSCANCTMVCPTCFCTTVQDTTDLTGEIAERWRSWDSCFTSDFSYIHGGSVRVSTKSRYRQWLVHKLGAWLDQFGTSGCVGCGRCITWCPVGIDITEQVKTLRENNG